MRDLSIVWNDCNFAAENQFGIKNDLEYRKMINKSVTFCIFCVIIKTKNLKRVLILLFVTVFLFTGYGQENRSLFPDGFHIGITGEGNLAQRMTVVAIGQNWPAPISDPTLGWQAGIAFSYHISFV